MFFSRQINETYIYLQSLPRLCLAVPKLCSMMRSLVPPCAIGPDHLLFPAPWLQVNKGQKFFKTIMRSMEVFEEQRLMKAMAIAV